MLLKTRKLRSPSSWYIDTDVHIAIDTERSLFSFSGANSLPRATITNSHKPGGLNNRNLHPLSSGVQTSKFKVLGESDHAGGCQEKDFLPLSQLPVATSKPWHSLVYRSITNLHLQLQTVFFLVSSVEFKFLLSHKDTSHWTRADTNSMASS